MKACSRIAMAAAVLAMSVAANAAPVSGNLSVGVGIAFSTTEIDFLPAGGSTGTFLVREAAEQSGAFVALAGTSGTVHDLNSGAQPVGVPFFLPEFMTFDADANTRFDLNFIIPGLFAFAECDDAPAAGQICTPPGSPFNLTNTGPDSSEMTFSVAGLARNLPTGEVSPLLGTFTVEFANDPFQDLLATISAGGTVISSGSAVGRFDARPQQVVNEPATLLMLAGGLIGLVATRRGKPLAE